MQDASYSGPLVLGIDVGGSKTQLRAFAGDTPVAGHIRFSNGRRPHDPVAAAGWPAVRGQACETRRQCEQIRTALRLHFDAPALVVGDAELLVPAAGPDQRVGLGVGTGPVTVGRLPDGRFLDGRLLQAGGRGAALGDEGGAAGPVREAARAAGAAHDRGEEPDALTAGLIASFEVPEVPAPGTALERAQDVTAEWRRHAPAGFAAAAGSRLARTVTLARTVMEEEGGGSLAAPVGRLAARGVVDDDVVTGSMLLAQPLLHDASTTALTDRVPAARRQPRPGPVPPRVRAGHQGAGGASRNRPWSRRSKGRWRSRVHSSDTCRTPGRPRSDTARP
ncbi:ATPase [Streptomyces blattellae]|uniref:ATPase n=1 Tax=Streptomyces blattellae TaxID=2569855 RepID=UPI0038B5B619